MPMAIGTTSCSRFFARTSFSNLPAPVVVVASRHLHFCTDGPVCIGDDTAGIPPTRIHQNGDFQQAILAIDLGRTGHLMDIRTCPNGICAPFAPVTSTLAISPGSRRNSGA